MVEEGLIERLWALGDRHSPRRVLVVTPDEVAARWLTSLLSERGALVGTQVVSLEGLLRAAMTELVGPSWTRAQLSGWVREALLEDPEGRFEAVADHPSYQRAVLQVFVELERACAGAVEGLAGLEQGPRDPMLIEAFGRFRARLPDEGGWWRGRAPVEVVLGRERVSFLRRRAAAVALGFVPDMTPRWQVALLDALGFERWTPRLGVPAAGVSGRAGKLDLRLSCAGPEAEIAVTSRHLRAEPERSAAILCPSAAVSRWAARLAHRDVPVRAYVAHPAAHTGAARTVMALLELLAEPKGARRGRLEAVLFGPALRPWSALAETTGIDYPRGPHPGDLDEAWQQQRASFIALASLAERSRAAAAASAVGIRERGARLGWSSEDLEARLARAEGARLLLAAALERLDEVAQQGPPGLHALLDDWDLLGRAAVHGVSGPEMIAARVSIELAGRAREPPLDEQGFEWLAMALDHALSASVSGRWEQRQARGGGPPVWIVPYSAVASVGTLPERVIMTGLDAHPRPPATGGLLSEGLRSALGLVEERRRFAVELRILDELAARPGQIVASWRHRDGTGARRPPGPWIAGRQDQGREQVVGVDAIALAPGSTPRAFAPHERGLLEWREQGPLRRRIEAIASHDAPEVGPHTGALGVATDRRQPYSASALQRYASLPYAYFVERVIGLREREKGSDSAASLLAREQGQVVHRALETALARALEAVEPMPLNLGQTSESLFEAVSQALAAGYEARARHGQAEAIWASERDRWLTELRHWWARWDQRMRAGAGRESGADTGRSGIRSRPEPEVLIPGPLLLATEWSIGPDPATDEVFELDLLGLRTIPFVGIVDRIELDLGRQRLDIVDYKTGRPVPPGRLNAELRAGAHLQLPLYALAINQIVARDPSALRLPTPLPVGALRLEYLRRPPARGSRPPRSEARGFNPAQPLGVDAYANTWTVLDAAASFTLAFVSAIEAGHFPLVARVPARRGPGSDRFAELARVVAPANRRASGVLPPSLAPLPDPKQAREVVR